jgi:hypothetical protein
VERTLMAVCPDWKQRCIEYPVSTWGEKNWLSTPEQAIVVYPGTVLEMFGPTPESDFVGSLPGTR